MKLKQKNIENSLTKNPKILGITGGIGSGKTFLMNYLKSKKIPIYIADKQAKKIANSEEVKAIIAATFGSQILTDGLIDKKKIATLIFKNKSQRKKLNQIIHPLVKKHWNKWLLSKKKHRWVAKESAILLETNGRKYCDLVINVVAPMSKRVDRIMKRDQLENRDQALERINAQWNDNQRNKLSDFIIFNNSKINAIMQLNKILNENIIN